MYRNEAIKKWSKLDGRQISETKYDEICQNLSGFFKMLDEWDKEDKESNRIDKIA